MEERLDDAINVLRNHAESVGGGPQSALVGPGAGPANSLSHSNGIMTAYPPVLDPLMVLPRLAVLVSQLFIWKCCIKFLYYYLKIY